MDEDTNSESANAHNAADSPGAGRGLRRERGLSRALSVLRASTKVQQQKRDSSSHIRIFEEDEAGIEAEEDSTSKEDSSRRRIGCGMTSTPRSANRNRAAGVVTSVEGQQRRNAPRGDWSPAEEAVLARKHMELGNKWTTISHFLPARSDNDVKNIWHSTLRSKNSERRSFLRTYARAVRDCANDAEARKQAYEMAQRVCGPPQPIEQALAAVQQQYQLQLQMNASQQEEYLGDGDSPEFLPEHDRDDDRELEHTSGPMFAHECSQPSHQHLGPQDSMAEPLRSGTCSRTNSAPDSQQLGGQKELVPSRACTSPLDVLDAAAGGGGPCLLYSAQMQARGSLTLHRGSSHSLGLSSGHALMGDDLPMPQQQQYQQQKHPQSQGQQQKHPQLLFASGGCASSRTGPEVDSTCVARLSTLHLADQLQCRQQHMRHMQHQAALLPQPGMLALANSSPSGPNNKPQPLQHQQGPLGGAQPSYLGLTAGPGVGHLSRSSASGPSQNLKPLGSSQVLEPSSSSATASATAGGCLTGAFDLDDMLKLGLDLTAEDLAMLSQHGGQRTSAGMTDPALAAMLVTHTPEQLRAMQQHQPSSTVPDNAVSSIFQNANCCSMDGGVQGSGLSGDLQQLPSLQQMQLGVQPPMQLDAFDSLLAELEQRGRLQVQPQPPLAGMHSLQFPDQQQQDDVLGLGQLGSPYIFPLHRCSPGSLDMQLLGGIHRGGLVAPHNTCVELQSLASCSSTIEMLNSGQQTFVDVSNKPQMVQQPSVAARRASALGMSGTAACNESFSNASSGLMSPLGISSGYMAPNGVQRTCGGNQYPLSTVGAGGVWHASACGAATGWTPGILRSSALQVNPAMRTTSSPPAVRDDVAAGAGSDAGAVGMLGCAATAIPSGVGGSGSGLLGRGSGLVPSMSSLAVPTHVDVVTMGLDFGELLDVMDCEGEPMQDVVSGSGLLADEAMDITQRTSAKQSFLQQHQTPTLTPTPPQQQQQQQQQKQGLGGQGQQQGAGGRNGVLLLQQGGDVAGTAGAQPCWSASKASPSYSSERIGSMLRL